MLSRSPPSWDWRDGGFYSALLALERPAFAWEWLRRDAGYRRDAQAFGVPRRHRSGVEVAAADERAFKWGLHAFEDPDRPAPLARPLWRRSVHPYVLEAEAGPEGAAGDRFSLAAFGTLATLVEEKGAQHVLLSDGERGLRLDLVGSSLSTRIVTFRYRLEGFEAAERPLLTLRRLLAFVGTGRFSPRLHPPDVRARRWVALLRTTDALAAGAGQREIAEHLLAREAAEPRWRVEAPTLRSRAQRLVRQARAMANGGYLKLLQ
jgi:hypothetical protein